MQAAQLIAEIRNPATVLTDNDIRTAWDALKQRHSALKQAQAATFFVGQPVEFTARGVLHQGNVVRVNQKTVSVKVGAIKWSVGASSLRAR
jgi:hypothetical protein